MTVMWFDARESIVMPFRVLLERLGAFNKGI